MIVNIIIMARGLGINSRGSPPIKLLNMNRICNKINTCTVLT